MDRERLIEESIHSGEMEGTYVSAEFRQDAEQYVRGNISIEELVKLTKRRWTPAEERGIQHMSEAFLDPYIDPKTGILRNLVGASTYKELNNAEGELVSTRMSEFLTKLPIKAKGTLKDLKFIHRFLFQDVYDWAGEIRTVEIKKASEGSNYFLPSCKITTGLGWSEEELDKDKLLRGLSTKQFAERLAYNYDNYNFVHPFREGNGRTQRLLWTLICYDAGYDLEWRNVSGEENNKASSLAINKGDRSALVSIFLRIAVPCDPTRPLNDGLA